MRKPRTLEELADALQEVAEKVRNADNSEIPIFDIVLAKVAIQDIFKELDQHRETYLIKE